MSILSLPPPPPPTPTPTLTLTLNSQTASIVVVPRLSIWAQYLYSLSL